MPQTKQKARKTEQDDEEEDEDEDEDEDEEEGEEEEEDEEEAEEAEQERQAITLRLCPFGHPYHSSVNSKSTLETIKARAYEMPPDKRRKFNNEREVYATFKAKTKSQIKIIHTLQRKGISMELWFLGKPTPFQRQRQQQRQRQRQRQQQQQRQQRQQRERERQSPEQQQSTTINSNSYGSIGLAELAIQFCDSVASGKDAREVIAIMQENFQVTDKMLKDLKECIEDPLGQFPPVDNPSKNWQQFIQILTAWRAQHGLRILSKQVTDLRTIVENTSNSNSNSMTELIALLKTKASQ